MKRFIKVNTEVKAPFLPRVSASTSVHPTGQDVSMRRICILLPFDRNLEGELSIQDQTGRVTEGPFAISGRAADSIAAAHGNPQRNPLLPYGDPPCGLYKIGGIRESCAATGLRPDLYGRAGAIVLLPWSGDAALADAVGRFEILIHGGALSERGELRVTSGHFRVSDAVMAALKTELRAPDAPQWVACTEEGASWAAINSELSSSGWSQTPPAIRTSRAALAVTFGEYSPTDDPELGAARLEVDPQNEATSIAEQVGAAVVSVAQDLGLQTFDTFGGQPIAKEDIAWAQTAANLAGGLAGAGELYSNGQVEAAYDAAKETLVAAMPDIAAVVATDIAAPTLVEATVAVGIGSAVAGMTMSAGAILVTSAVVTVGIATAVTMGAEKITEVCVDLAKKHL